MNIKYVMVYAGAFLLGLAGGMWETVVATIGLAAIIHGVVLAIEEAE